MRLSLIVAMDDKQLIGKNNALPWHLPADLRHFKKITTGKTVLMGRKTYQSIGKALPNRRNVIISHNPDFKATDCEVVNSIDAALMLVENDVEVMIMGGAGIYQQFLPQVERLYITRVEGTFIGDAYFPQFNQNDFIEIDRKSQQKDEKNPHNYHFTVLQRK